MYDNPTKHVRKLLEHLRKPIDDRHTPRVGGILNERYRLLKFLGSGGMGEVFSARDLLTGGIVAVKFLKRRFFKREYSRRRFIREAEISACLNSPGLIRIYGFFDEPRPHLVMERLRGLALNSYIKEYHPSLTDRLKLGQSICSILSTVHGHGIVHRDLKPANLFVERPKLKQGRPVSEPKVTLLDFGLASWKGHDGPPSTRKRVKPLGTCTFMAPEQARKEATDARSDIYSLGVILYRYTAGQLPFRGGSKQEIIYKQACCPAEDPCQVKPSLPPQLGRLLLRILSKDPQERPQTAEELSAELGRIIEALGGTGSAVSADDI